MTKVDQTVDSAADKLAAFVKDAQRGGGVKAKIGAALAEDPEFIRKLKPSLIKARAKGEAPIDEPPGANGDAPAEPAVQPQRPRPSRGTRRRGVSPWLVVGAAFVGGYVLAKTIDWRSHAHPRY